MIAAGIVSGFLAGATQLYFPQAVGRVVDEGRLSVDFALFIFGVLCLGGLSRFGERVLFSSASQSLIARLRSSTFDSILRQEVGFFDEERAGDLTSRLMGDAQALEEVLVGQVVAAMRSLVLVGGGAIVLLWMSPLLTLVLVGVLTPFVLFVNRLGRRVAELAHDYQTNTGDMASIAAEAISGIRTVRASDQEAFMSQRYRTAALGNLAIGRRTNFVYGVVRGVSVVGPEMLVVILVGMPQLSAGAVSTGGLAAFAFTGMLALGAVRDLAECSTEVRRASGALKRILEVLGREPRIPVGEGKGAEAMTGEVVFEGVGFAYPSRPEVPVLHDLSLAVRPGEVVALVGASGAGKSTLAGLLLRFHDPLAGRILIDGADSRTLDGRWLRRHIGFVSQEPTLFALTIAENIRFGLDHVSTAEVVNAARAANAHDFITGLPQGFETRVGERGVQLSGGQRQRIAIARTVLKDPRILILDEATSALDSESESLVHEAVERLMQGRTTLVIAHRLSTIRSADRVIVLDGGRVVESGTHGSLMRQGSVYAELVENQIFSA